MSSRDSSQADMETFRQSRMNLFIQAILAASILLLYLFLIPLALTPPIARDALIHHLAIPKLWLLNGGFYEIKWADFSYYPMNIDLLYLICLYLNNDILPHFIHMGFGIATALLVYHYLARHFDRITGLLGVLVFVSTPLVMRMSTVAYVDLGLTFFTTASILAMIRWRAGKYQESKWLLISATAMGLALGTKYNALLAWVLLTSSVVFLHTRDTGAQWRAVRFGLVHFLVSLALFSPWLIKNFLLTGNPLYPLFTSLFESGMTSAVSDGSTRSLVSGNTHMGMFPFREALYGEGFWETLLIPLRFFFQGQDDSWRYFDGVLNPILVILAPFAFLQKSHHGDKVFFLLLSVFFVIITFFLDQLHVRYILPAIPFLAILSALGIRNAFVWISARPRRFRAVCLSVFLLFLALLGARNAAYLNGYYERLKPGNYLLCKESREDYLKRNIGSYAAMAYINRHTPPGARIRLMFLARRGYYLDRIYVDDATYGMDVMRGLAANAGDDKSFRNDLDALGCTHLLMHMDMSNKFLRDNYPPQTIDQLSRRLERELEMIHHANGYAVYRIIPAN